MTAACDMQAPVPGTPDVCGLCVQTVIPATHRQFKPTLGVDRKRHMPRAPGELVLRRKILIRHGIPHEASIRTDFDSLGPTTSPRIGPSFAFDRSVVDDYLLLPGTHDRAADGHFLDLNASRIHLVVLAHLAVKVEVLFLLDRGTARVCESTDLVKPLDRSRADVAIDYGSERKAMDLWQGLVVHLESEDYFVGFDLRPGN
jgi:hypothetical protein